MLILWLLLSYYVRAEQLQQRSDDSQSLKYLLSDPFQKKLSTGPWIKSFTLRHYSFNMSLLQEKKKIHYLDFNKTQHLSFRVSDG